MTFYSGRFGRSLVATLAGSVTLAGCATLPSSGPTAHQILSAAPHNTMGYHIVNIDPSVTQSVIASEPAEQGSFAGLDGPQAIANDVLGVGDVLQISVFEVGVSLFGASVSAIDPSAKGQVIPPVTVDRAGDITLPYAGRMHVAGRTPTEVGHMIERGLKSLSQQPQVLVSLRDNVANSVYVFGDVRKPARLPLTLGRERLLDAITSAGGSPAPNEDTVVRLTRGGRTVEERLDLVRSGGAEDILLRAGDHIELVRRPRTFIVLGATNKVSQLTFDSNSLSLAEALARTGGPNDAAADPTAIFLFRYVRAPGSDAVEPVIYRLNMLDPANYFLAQRFMVRDKDVLYVGNARANQPSKFISIINQLFAPVVTARYITQ